MRHENRNARRQALSSLLDFIIAIGLCVSLTGTHQIGWANAQPQQNPKPATSPQQEPTDTIKLLSELVTLDVSVLDSQNRFVTGLTQTDFILFEDNVKQQVAFFSQEEVPTSIGLVVDTSRSMAPKLNNVIAAALRLIRESHPEDEFFLVEFKAQAELVQDFTKKIEDIEEALGDLVAHGQTALLDAIYLSVQHAQKQAKHRRKAIVLISDGEERDSYYTESQVLEALRASDVQVYVIGFTAGIGADQYNIFKGTGKRKISRQEKRARRYLEHIAQATGGRVFYPESLSELDGIAQSIARELRAQYVIGYYPTNAERDGKWRTVRVELKPSEKTHKASVRTRSGYYANPLTESKRAR
ncbi:MAG: VWA domain-containing protein [Acidobacteriota bacterium]|nr:VWA domain-containing protein [Blastocatellia bacterium]MDW8239617.1 VWA domain-containing protein [Acidobacteriota bacterium]